MLRKNAFLPLLSGEDGELEDEVDEVDDDEVEDDEEEEEVTIGSTKRSGSLFGLSGSSCEPLAPVANLRMKTNTR